MSADVAVRLCEWVTCDDTPAVPGSLFCAPHGRIARQEGAPWRHPESAPPRETPNPPFLTPPPDGTSVPEPAVGPQELPPPIEAHEPARRGKPLQPARKTCRIPGCDEPCLERTTTLRSNRWRNLCDRHYREARHGALGPRRQAQVAVVAPASNGTVEPHPRECLAVAARLQTQPCGTCEWCLTHPQVGSVIEHVEPARSYSERAAELVEVAQALDDARADAAEASQRVEALEGRWIDLVRLLA